MRSADSEHQASNGPTGLPAPAPAHATATPTTSPPSTVTTHVLDTTLGRPAAGVRVRLERRQPGASVLVAAAVTDDDGRVRRLGPDDLALGTYRLVFDTATYFAAVGTDGFYPEVAITFTVSEAGAQYHVPLLLSPYGFSTYRGS